MILINGVDCILFIIIIRGRQYFLDLLVKGCKCYDKKYLYKILKNTEETHSVIKPSNDPSLSSESHRIRSIQAWNTLAQNFGATEELKELGDHDAAMLAGLKNMFSSHRDYLSELCKSYGLSILKEEQKIMYL